ncbi:MAG: transposase [Deltaproteobacteria bacterium]|nr:transposase [Deltaproteobacteria bacterium]
MSRRKFKPEFKRRVVEEWVSGGQRIAQICRKYQLSDSLVRNWRKQYERDGPEAWDPPVESDGELAAAERRIAELEAALGRATMEVDFMKRAVKRLGIPFPPELKP